MAEIVDEIKALADKGTKEVTLLGQIVNQYAIQEFPLRTKSPFVQLEKVNAIDGIERIRFSNPHPLAKQDLIECYQRSQAHKYLHFPCKVE